MSLKKRSNSTSKRKNSRILKLSGCIICAAAVSFIVISLIAYIMVKKDMSDSIIKYLWFAVAFIGGFASAFYTAKVARVKGIIAGIIGAGAESVILLIIILIVNSFKVSPETFLILPSSLLGSSIGGILAANMRK